MVTIVTTIMAIRATMATPHRSSILIVRHRRHIQHPRSQPARAVAVAVLVAAGIHAEVLTVQVAVAVLAVAGNQVLAGIGPLGGGGLRRRKRRRPWPPGDFHWCAGRHQLSMARLRPAISRRPSSTV
jgi:hypothetical protein